MESWINQWILFEIAPDYEFAFQGFDSISEDAKQKADIESMKAFRTINEVRAMYDLEPIDNEAANMVLDASYMNMAFQIEQSAGGDQPDDMDDMDEGSEFGEAGEEEEEKDSAMEDSEEEESETPDDSPEEFSRSILVSDPRSVPGATEENAPSFPIQAKPVIRSVVVEVD